jgi:hypothetical protein
MSASVAAPSYDSSRRFRWIYPRSERRESSDAEYRVAILSCAADGSRSSGRSESSGILNPSQNTIAAFTKGRLALF